MVGKHYGLEIIWVFPKWLLFMYTKICLLKSEGFFFQVLETSEVNFRVGNEKGHIPPKDGTHRGGVSH